MIRFAKEELWGVLFWAGREVFSLEKEDIFQQKLQAAASLHLWWAELSLGQNHLGRLLPLTACPSISHPSPLFSQVPFPSSPKLGDFWPAAVSVLGDG